MNNFLCWRRVYAVLAVVLLVVMSGSAPRAEARVPVAAPAAAGELISAAPLDTEAEQSVISPIAAAASAASLPAATAAPATHRPSSLMGTDGAPEDAPIEYDGGDGVDAPEISPSAQEATLAPAVTPPPAGQATPEPLAPGQPAPYILQVDVKNQIVSAYGLDADGLYSVLIRQMLCSTGTKATPTPLGKFEMPGGPRDRHKWAFFPEYKVYAKFTSRIYQGILFHSVLYKNSKTLISSSVRNLGKRASHGCIRLQVKDAEWIYYNCPPGTVVYVFDDAAPNPELVKQLKAEVTSKQ